MKPRRQDMLALALFLAVAAGGLWLWAGEGAAVWLADVAALCGFS